MKKLILICFIGLSYSVTARPTSADGCDHCTPGLTGLPSSALPSDIAAFANFATQEKRNSLRGLANNICTEYGRSGGNLKETIPNEFKKYFQRHNLGEANKENIIRFINANKDYLNCAGESRGNFIKVAIAKIHYSEVIKGYLFPISKRNNANVEVDFNAVEMVNGKPETIVDFIDALIADEVEGYSFSNQTKDELKRLRRVLVDEQRGFGAKRFAELPKEIQDQYLSGTILATRK
jgi:hypothetical protein